VTSVEKRAYAIGESEQQEEKREVLSDQYVRLLFAGARSELRCLKIANKKRAEVILRSSER
jgi:hypothetical protein